MSPDERRTYEQVIRKRRELSLQYFRHIPETWVHLDIVMEDAHGSFITFWKRPHGLHNTCGAVGCVMGWLSTMPEVREWVQETQISEIDSGYILAKFLGVEDAIGLFGERASPDISQKEEAIQRLERLQNLPITYDGKCV